MDQGHLADDQPQLESTQAKSGEKEENFSGKIEAD